MTLVGTGGSLSPSLALNAHVIGRLLDGSFHAVFVPALHHPAGFAKVPLRSVTILGNWSKQVPLPDALDEGRVLPEFPAVKLMRVEDSNWQPILLGDDTRWLRQIGIIGDQNRHLEPFHVGVPQQVGSEVHIRALFFRLVHSDLLRGYHVGQVHRNRMRQDAPILDVQVRNRPERPDVQALVVSRGGVVSP